MNKVIYITALTGSVTQVGTTEIQNQIFREAWMKCKKVLQEYGVEIATFRVG